MPFASGLYGSIKSSIRASVRNSIRGVDSSCNVYLFSNANTDKLTFTAPFTGNIKVILAANAETGINPDILAGRQNLFEASTDPVNEPNWIQYEADVASLTYIVDETFNGVVGKFALDDIWYAVDMGARETFFALNNSSYEYALFNAVEVQNTDTISFNVIGVTGELTQFFLGSSTTNAYIYYRSTDGRLRIVNDAGKIYDMNGVTVINDGQQHYVEIRLGVSDIEAWVDGVLVSSTGFGSAPLFTFDVIGDQGTLVGGMSQGAIFGITLGAYASWAMVSERFSVNVEDSIGSNDLTFVGTPTPILESDFVGVVV